MLPAELVAALAPGTVISGKYRVERPLGTGGMGVVVAARHLELNQDLAIKVLLPSAASSNEATTRFLREGRSAAQLTSPHVAKVHDTGRLPSGAPYLVMELLRGRDLRAHLAEVGRVPLAQAVDWILQAAHALAEAHALNIIHRDVKPANLFLAETSAGQQIKVLDFGVSKQLDSTEADLTTTTAAVGTPRYMAPEQMRSARFADARGDVWSLGIVLYELTTGRTPFQGDSIVALCFDIMERTPAAPSSLNPELPHSFDEVLARCLEKDPDRRLQSMTELAAALGAIPSVPLTAPLAQPLSPERHLPEAMPPSNTIAALRPRQKRTPRIPLVALGVGVAIAAAMLVGMLAADRSVPPCPHGSGRDSSGQCVATKPCPEWIDAAGGHLPSMAVKGGYEPRGWDLYVCRAELGSGPTVSGKLINGWGCYVADGSTEVLAKNYQVLSASPECNLSWEPAPVGVPPGNAFEASADPAISIKICRAALRGGVHIGWTGWSTNHRCVISYGGMAHSTAEFEVLARK